MNQLFLRGVAVADNSLETRQSQRVGRNTSSTSTVRESTKLNSFEGVDVSRCKKVSLASQRDGYCPNLKFKYVTGSRINAGLECELLPIREQ